MPVTVAVESSWDASVAVAACTLRPWSGSVWRCHGRQYAGDNAEGSLKVSGRFNRGTDTFPAHETWAVLYTSVAQHVALGERIRHTPVSNLSRLRVDLQVVICACLPERCAQLMTPGLDEADLCHLTDHRKIQAFALAVRTVAEALLIPSCTKFPEGNLIIFPDRMMPGSTILVEETQDPELVVDWDSL